MKKKDRISIDAALELFLDWVIPIARTTTISIDDADDRVLSQDTIAPISYPHYDQCILDGYGVKAASTQQNADGIGPKLTISKSLLNDYDCVLAHTGDALPDGADAILPLENIEESEGSVTVTKAVDPGQWVWKTGAGIRGGDLVFKEGMQLKPTDIAILVKLGIESVQVYDRPKVLIVPTGDELIGRGGELRPGAVYESNGLMCKLLLKRYGADPLLHAIVEDNVNKLKEALYEGQSYDLAVTIGGSSASKRDLMEETTQVAGKLAFHEVGLHPGNHMGAGKIISDKGSTPLIFLAGYTESCAVGAMVFANAAIRKLGHYPPVRYARERAVLTNNVKSPLGVRSVRKMCVSDQKAMQVMLIAESFRTGNYPYLIIPEDIVEYEAGAEVECVHLE